jgi:hypothetical protein
LIKVNDRAAARRDSARRITKVPRAAGMRVELLVCAGSAPCARAERVWREVAADGGFELEVIDLRTPIGEAIEARLQLTAIPAVVIDGHLAGVGVQSPDEARALLRTRAG